MTKLVEVYREKSLGVRGFRLREVYVNPANVV